MAVNSCTCPCHHANERCEQCCDGRATKPGYREENDQVILTMSREDYQLMLMLLGAGAAGARIVSGKKALEFLNRLNQGNPHYTPYQV